MTSDRYIRLPGRAVVALAGDEARPFLQGIVTNDVEQVSPARAVYAALLTPQGKFLHDFFIAERDGRLLLDCDRSRVDDLLKRLKMYRLRAKVEIADETESWQVLALPQPASEPGAAEAWLGGVAFADPRHAGLGRRAIVPAGADPAAEGLTEGDLAELDALRLSLGVPDDRDLVPEKSLPLECGFDELHGVSFTKGCYVGQEVTARMKHRNLVKKRLFPVTVAGAVETGTAVKCGDVNAGEIRSVRNGRAIALLRLDLAEREGLSAGGVAVQPEKPDWMSF